MSAIRPDKTRYTMPSLGDRRRGTRRRSRGGRALHARRRIHRGTQTGRIAMPSTPRPSLAARGLLAQSTIGAKAKAGDG